MDEYEVQEGIKQQYQKDIMQTLALKPSTARGEETRRRLLDVALGLFAVHGYRAVSTRMIAQSAGVNPAGIGFHFNGKSGLYQAVVDQMLIEFSKLSKAFNNMVTPLLTAATPVPATLGDTLAAAVETFVVSSVQSRHMRLLSMLYQQEQAAASQASRRVYEEVGRPLLVTLECLAECSGIGPRQSPEARTLALCILSMMTTAGSDPALLVRYVGQDAYTPDFVTTLARTAARGARGLLGL